jgi:hypothetical protein
VFRAAWPPETPTTLAYPELSLLSHHLAIG